MRAGSGVQKRVCLRGIIVTLLLCPAALLPPRLPAQETRLRNLTGTVADHQHEPLKGAIVQVQLEDTSDIVSYITDRDGHYSFKRLSWSSDYKVWVTFRGQKSKTKEMSHFDSKPDKVIDFVVELKPTD